MSAKRAAPKAKSASRKSASKKTAAKKTAAKKSPARKRAGGASSGSGKPEVPEFTPEQEMKAFEDMLLIRRFEEKAGQM